MMTIRVRYRPTAIRAALLGLAAAFTAVPALAAPVGFVTTLEGIAQVQRENATTWETAAIDGSVSVGDSIRTERNSLVKVLLVDDTILTIAEDSEVFIDRMIVGDLATQERSILREMRGQVRAQVGQAFGGTTRLEIHTPTAIVGVRGSTMNVKVKRRRGARGWVTVAAIQEGTGFACAKKSGAKKPGDCIELDAGQLSTIPEGGLPSSAAPIPSGFDAPLSAGGGETGIADAGGGGPEINIDNQLGIGGDGVGGGPDGVAAVTETAMLTGQSLNVTNSYSQNVGPTEAINTEATLDGAPGEVPTGIPLTPPESPALFGGDPIRETPGDPPVFGDGVGSSP